jgi:SAM-dependent methyltransferase
MAKQKDNLVVSLLKKSVGLPTGESNCCGAPAQGADLAATSAADSAFPDAIRATVREHYADIARTRDTSSECCGPAASCCSNTLYPADMLASLPTDVTDLSLGCGDPVTLAGLRPGDTVVDLGSGGGIDCFLAAQRVGAQGHVIGVDMTQEMIERARANATTVGAANVEFRLGQIEAMPVEDGTADAIISNCVINLSPDKPQVFREIFRALKPGGRIAVSDIVTSGPMPEALRNDLDAWSACVSGAIPAEDYAEGLRDAGFVDVQVMPKGTMDTSLALIPAGTPFSALITARKSEAR